MEAKHARDLGARVTELLRRYVPIVTWLPAYERKDLPRDAIAGLTSWGVMVPVALAYAVLAGVAPEFGLITAFSALAAYAVFGTSRHLKVTTSSTMAVMSLSLLGPLAGGDPIRLAALSAALALVVGAILVAAGLLRLGFISEFLAKPVVTGFIVGVALTVIVGQLPKLLGVPSTSGSVTEQLAGLITHLPETSTLTLAMGLGALAIILGLRLIDRRIPGSLVALVLGIVLVTAFDLDQQGVAIVGTITTPALGIGLPAIQLSDLVILITGAVGIVFLAVGESLGAGRAFAARHRYELDADQELIALGAANGASGLFGGFIVDASLSQSATAESAGTRTQLSSLLTSALILATALFLAPLFGNLPMAVLGAIVIAAMLGLIDIAEMRRYWAWRRADGLLAIVALIGVTLTSVLGGLVIAVLLSLLLLLFRASRPYLAVVGRLPGERAVYADISRHDDAAEIPGMLLIRLDAPLYFFNATVARTQILEQVDDRSPSPRVVIVNLAATVDLDVTTTDMLAQLVTDLENRGARLALAQAKAQVRDRLARTGLVERIGPSHIHLSLGQAVAAERGLLDSAAGDRVPAQVDVDDTLGEGEA